MQINIRQKYNASANFTLREKLPSISLKTWEEDIDNAFLKFETDNKTFARRMTNIVVLLLLIVICLPGCKKIVEVDGPIDSIVGQEIFNTNTGAASVMTGIYTTMSLDGIFAGTQSISLRAGLSADEFVPVTTNDIMNYLYTNSLTNNGNQLFWQDLYSYIFRANSAIEGVTASTGISGSMKQRLLGEAKFIRGFMYFYLVNLYGDIPLLTTTDIKINATEARTEKNKVYQQIIKDLQESESLLSENYVAADGMTPTSDRLRPNKSTATALLARVYLYMGEWQLAEQECSKVISNTSTYQIESLDNAFLTTSKEAIWQIQSVNATFINTLDGRMFVLAAGDGLGAGANVASGRPVYMNSQLYNSFENGDSRQTDWVDTVIVGGTTYPYVYKYKAWIIGAQRTEHLMVLRLSEQFLIRAEARTHQGKVIGANSATEDLNLIRSRAGLGPTPASTQTDMLDAILQERKVELFGEWGHRWLDLKRTGKVDEVMSTIAPIKGGSWSPYKALYPIPVGDIQRNPNLKGHQNPGYPEQ